MVNYRRHWVAVTRVAINGLVAELTRPVVDLEHLDAVNTLNERSLDTCPATPRPACDVAAVNVAPVVTRLTTVRTPTTSLRAVDGELIERLNLVAERARFSCAPY